MHVEKFFRPSDGSFKTVSFTGQIRRLLSSGRFQGASRPAQKSEVVEAVFRARAQIPGLAGDETIFSVATYNPEALRVIDFGQGATGSAFFSYLPLNAAGLRALVDGHFTPSAPGLELLCKPSERPEALYVWLVLAPGRFVAGLAAMAAHFDEIAPEGCPLFTKPATPLAFRMFRKMGFMPAHEVFPSINGEVLVVFPTSASQAPPATPATGKSVATITTRVARTSDDVTKVFMVRAATYMSEQECPFEEEFDGNDFSASHILGEVDGEPAGCIRIRYFGEFVKFERLAVRHEFRKSRVAFKLVRTAMELSARKGFRRVYGHARQNLVRFWRTFGFRPLPRPPFVFSDIVYVEMAGELGPVEDVICEGQDPMQIIRPEGAWDEPGPLDRSAMRDDTRARRIEERVRRVRVA